MKWPLVNVETCVQKVEEEKEKKGAHTIEQSSVGTLEISNYVGLWFNNESKNNNNDLRADLTGGTVSTAGR